MEPPTAATYPLKSWGLCPQRRCKGWVLAMLALWAARGSGPRLRGPCTSAPRVRHVAGVQVS